MFSKIWSAFGARKRFKKAKNDAEEIVKLAQPYLDLITALASPGLERNVSSWNLGNPYLAKFIAYVGGVLDVADFLVKKSKGVTRGDNLGMYLAFHWYVEFAFKGVPNVDIFIKLLPDSIYVILENNTETAGMPWMVNDDYPVYERLGANDFFEFLDGNPGFFPTGLSEVGVFEDGEKMG